MALLLEVQESEKEIMSGFPEYVILTTNISSTIFYTLDGSTPTEESEIFVDRLYLPTTGLTLILKVWAVSEFEVSEILEQIYFTDQSTLDRTRRLSEEGINILPSGEEEVEHLSFDQEGEWSQSSSISFTDLEMRASTVNKRGEDISGDTTLSFVNFPIKSTFSNPKLVSKLSEISFNPKASYIIIDGSTDENLASQTIRIINRPYGTLEPLSSLDRVNQNNFQLNTSSLVRQIINPKNGKITFYYRDSRDNRWLNSTQQMEGRILNLSPKDAGPPNSYVFRWIEDRSLSLIF